MSLKKPTPNRLNRYILLVKGRNYQDYVVRINRLGIDKHFSCRIGQEEALKAARAYRDSVVAEHPEFKLDGLAQRIRKTDPRNNTGVAGVQFVKKWYESTGWAHYYAASWIEPGIAKQKKKIFTVNKHGKDKAFQLACEERKKAEERIIKYYETQTLNP